MQSSRTFGFLAASAVSFGSISNGKTNNRQTDEFRFMVILAGETSIDHETVAA